MVRNNVIRQLLGGESSLMKYSSGLFEDFPAGIINEYMRDHKQLLSEIVNADRGNIK